MSCDHCLTQAVAAGAVPALLSKVVFSRQDGQQPKCPMCGGWLANNQVCNNPHCHPVYPQTTVNSLMPPDVTKKALLLKKLIPKIDDPENHDPLQNQYMADMYSKLATMIAGQPRKVILKKNIHGFMTDMQGTIWADPYPAGKQAHPAINLLLTKRGLLHELLHEEYSDRDVLNEVFAVAGSEQPITFTQLTGAQKTLSPPALRLVKDIAFVLEDGRIERCGRQKYAGVDQLFTAAAQVEQRWDGQVGSTIPQTTQLLGAMLHTALPYYSVDDATIEEMPEPARSTYKKALPLISQAVWGDADDVYFTAVQIAQMIQDSGMDIPEVAFPSLPQGEGKPRTKIPDPYQPEPSGDQGQAGQPGDQSQRGQSDGQRQVGRSDSQDQAGQSGGQAGQLNGQNEAGQLGGQGQTGQADGQRQAGGSDSQSQARQPGDQSQARQPGSQTETRKVLGNREPQSGDDGGDGHDSKSEDDLQRAGGQSHKGYQSPQNAQSTPPSTKQRCLTCGQWMSPGEPHHCPQKQKVNAEQHPNLFDRVVNDVLTEAGRAIMQGVQKKFSAPKLASTLRKSVYGDVLYKDAHGTITTANVMPPAPYSDSELPERIRRAKLSSRAIAIALERWKDEAIGTSRHQRQGRLDRRKFAKALAGDPNVYQRPDVVDLDTHITASIILDTSGSMGVHFESLVDAGLTTALALDQRQGDISYEMRAFNNKRSNHLLKPMDDAKIIPEHVNGIQLHSGFTHGAETIAMARNVLASAKGGHRIMFVMTDGAFNDVMETTVELEEARKTGIAIVGIYFDPKDTLVHNKPMIEQLNKCYGEGNWVQVTSLDHYPATIQKHLGRIYKKMGKLAQAHA